mmetsp:Transcript_6451/g.24090  ORF Transcript_6451/g.24090 Transcript_6451/m.24090 type:complete len:830 (-) Transcript_6451:998-3487(-)
MSPGSSETSGDDDGPPTPAPAASWASIRPNRCSKSPGKDKFSTLLSLASNPPTQDGMPVESLPERATSSKPFSRSSKSSGNSRGKSVVPAALGEAAPPAARGRSSSDLRRVSEESSRSSKSSGSSSGEGVVPAALGEAAPAAARGRSSSDFRRVSEESSRSSKSSGSSSGEAVVPAAFGEAAPAAARVRSSSSDLRRASKSPGKDEAEAVDRSSKCFTRASKAAACIGLLVGTSWCTTPMVPLPCRERAPDAEAGVGGIAWAACRDAKASCKPATCAACSMRCSASSLPPCLTATRSSCRALTWVACCARREPTAWPSARTAESSPRSAPSSSCWAALSSAAAADATAPEEPMDARSSATSTRTSASVVADRSRSRASLLVSSSCNSSLETPPPRSTAPPALPAPDLADSSPAVAKSAPPSLNAETLARTLWMTASRLKIASLLPSPFNSSVIVPARKPSMPAWSCCRLPDNSERRACMASARTRSASLSAVHSEDLARSCSSVMARLPSIEAKLTRKLSRMARLLFKPSTPVCVRTLVACAWTILASMASKRARTASDSAPTSTDCSLKLSSNFPSNSSCLLSKEARSSETAFSRRWLPYRSEAPGDLGRQASTAPRSIWCARSSSFEAVLRNSEVARSSCTRSASVLARCSARSSAVVWPSCDRAASDWPSALTSRSDRRRSSSLNAEPTSSTLLVDRAANCWAASRSTRATDRCNRLSKSSTRCISRCCTPCASWATRSRSSASWPCTRASKAAPWDSTRWQIVSVAMSFCDKRCDTSCKPRDVCVCSSNCCTVFDSTNSNLASSAGSLDNLASMAVSRRCKTSLL